MGRKTAVLIFQATNKRNLTQENLNIVKKENLKRETESLLIAAQNNTIRTMSKHEKTRRNKIADVDKDETKT